MKQLFFSKAFFGSMLRNWNPYNQPFISGVRYRVHILTLRIQFSFTKILLSSFMLLTPFKNFICARPNYSFFILLLFLLLFMLLMGWWSYSNFLSVRKHFRFVNANIIYHVSWFSYFFKWFSSYDFLINEGLLLVRLFFFLWFFYYLQQSVMV
jgi:hypothetical protein